MSNTKTEKEKMLAGELYDASDPELRTEFVNVRKLVKKYNEAYPDEKEYRDKLLHEIFPHAGENFYLEPPFHVDYGSNFYCGDNVYMNFDAVILDICPIHIGSRTMFGPRASLYTASHPVDYKIRNEGLEFGKPITIGEDCFIGGSVSFVPGVTVGDRVVIGTGSVVCKDIPSDCVAVGNPCKVIKKLQTPQEREEAIKQTK